MVQEFVYGVYASLNEAEAAIVELTGKGVSRSGIKLLASEDVVNHAQTTTAIEAMDDLSEKTSHWWEGLLDFFTFDTPHKSRNEAERKIDISGYKDNIDAGEVLVIVEGAFENAAYHTNLAATPPELTANTSDQLLDDSQDDSQEDLTESTFIESSDVTVSDLPEASQRNVADVSENEKPMADVSSNLPEASAESAVDSSIETHLPEQSETIETRNLPNNLYNPLSGASMADEPGVNIEEFEKLTEKEVDQLDRIDSTVDQEQPEAGAGTQSVSDFGTEGVENGEISDVTEQNLPLDENTETYGDPAIHQEKVERQPRGLDNLRHPREHITPADVQRTIDEICNPK